MSIPFYAKSEHNQGYIKNMKVVGFCDLNGINAFQMALYKTEDKYYMYCGSFKGAGVNVVDVTDPANPVVLNYVEVSDPKVYFAQSLTAMIPQTVCTVVTVSVLFMPLTKVIQKINF